MPDIDRHCKGKTKAGKRCRAAATEGGLCFFHANPDKVADLGRRGGRQNRHVVDEASALPKLDSIVALRDALAQIITDVHSRKLHPRVASSIAHLSNSLARAMELADLEARIQKLESALEAEDDDSVGSGFRNAVSETPMADVESEEED